MSVPAAQGSAESAVGMPTRERLNPLAGDKRRSAIVHAGALLAHGALALLAACVSIVLTTPDLSDFGRSAWLLALPPLWAVLAWLNHAELSRLHEAAHGMLARHRWANELLGVLIGTLSLTPLSVYRYVHHQHHAYLGGPRDPEFWPYNMPNAPRWLRLGYSWAELAVGWIVTPALYSLRTARAWGTIAPHQRRRLALEWTLLVVVWAAAIGLVAARGWWTIFAAAHLVPAWLTGIMQTIRKFTEHLGMHGDSILTMTRTVVYTGPVGRAASRSQLHVEHHGTHHRWARIPYHRLPEATRVVYGEEGSGPVFPTHWAAVRDMLPHLRDPRVGPQWRTPARPEAVVQPDRSGRDR
ncbi:MAG: fatty acid desaturase [Phycisphaerae bacterium]|nr:fatty acid desaturase [Phycisphaerae bacterium]